MNFLVLSFAYMAGLLTGASFSHVKSNFIDFSQLSENQKNEKCSAIIKSQQLKMCSFQHIESSNSYYELYEVAPMENCWTSIPSEKIFADDAFIFCLNSANSHCKQIPCPSDYY